MTQDARNRTGKPKISQATPEQVRTAARITLLSYGKALRDFPESAHPVP
jgi:hypothetical protein